VVVLVILNQKSLTIMRKKILITSLVIGVGLQSFVLKQLCDSLSFIKGATYEMENYRNGKKVGLNKTTVKDVVQKGSEKEATVVTEKYNESNQKTGESDAKIICTGDKVKIDIKDQMEHDASKGRDNMKMEVKESYLEFPLNPTVGQTIPDNVIITKVSDKNSGREIGEHKTSFVNRKVVSKEKVTTPAGTFECFKATGDIKTEMTMMGMNHPMSALKTVSYYNKEIGLIKSETYNESGQLMRSSVLSKYKKP